MAQVIRSPSFVRDVEAALEYLQARSPEAAERLAGDIDHMCDLLSGRSVLGRDRNDLVPGIRSVVVGRYVLLFRKATDGVTALRFIHGSRDLQTAVDETHGD